MIIYTKQGRSIDIPADLVGYDSGVWVFQFYGDETYIDPVDDEALYLSFYDSADMGRDSTDNRNDGTTTAVTQVTGPFDKGGDFNGTTSEIDCGDILDYTNNFTFTGWFNLDTVSSSQFIISRNISAFNDGQYGLRCDAGPLKISYTQGSTFYDLNTGFTPSINTDYFYRLELNAGVWNLYINEALEYTNNIGGALDSISGHSFFIGARSPGVIFLDGTLSEVRAFPRVLTETEGAALYTNNGWNTWYWTGVNNELLEIIGATYNGSPLTLTLSLADCTALAGSFYWDDTNGYYYVHYSESIGAWAVGADVASYSELYAGYASGYSPASRNYFDGLFFNPQITAFTGLKKKVDPLKFGLISFEEISFSLSNQNGALDGYSDTEAIGTALQAFAVDEDRATLENTDRIFTGTQYGYKNDRAAVKIAVIENRLFQNRPVCPNVISLTDYPAAGDNENKIIPTAWGAIRKGKLIPVNPTSLTQAASGSATLLLADPSLYALTAVSKIYDEAGEEITIDSTDLTACTVSITKAAGVSPSALNNYTWGGSGYAITGTFDNGLDIMKAAWLTLGGIPYLETTFDRSQWNAETLLNTASIGLSIQSDKGFIEELVEPITVSLQGVVDVLGDGRISFRSRNTGALILDTIEQYQQLSEPQLDEDPEEIVSELYLTYAPNFADKENDFLSYLYSDDKTTVVKDYGLNRRDPLSPVETVLVDEADIIALAEEIMQTSAQAQTKPITERVRINTDYELFAMIGTDVGRDQVTDYRYGEILTIEPDYINNTEKVTIREIPAGEENLPLYHQGRIMGTVLCGTSLLGYTRIRGSL